MEEAGEVRLDDLENISDYKAFCTKGGAEYIKSKDTGRGCSFWDHQHSSMANAHRVARLQQLVEASQHPESRLPEPVCDSQNAACHYHENCRNLSGACCPATTGMMLACCGSSFPHLGRAVVV